MECPTYESVIASKQLNAVDLQKEWKKLQNYKADTNKNCFIGNPLLYHFQLENLCRVKLKKGSFKDTMDDPVKREIAWANANKYANGSRANNLPMRLFEMWRRLNGAIVWFKPSVAMFMYKNYGATAVLDPTAGWGGRLLAAAAINIKYTGIDTNTNMIAAYNNMGNLINNKNINMIWADALTVDFGAIDYDFVLTSPPYFNLELYENMKPFENEMNFYMKFLIPLIDKCRLNIRRDGKVCFNIDIKMYSKLTEIYKYEKCTDIIDMEQQKAQGKDKGQKIYVW